MAIPDPSPVVNEWIFGRSDGHSQGGVLATQYDLVPQYYLINGLGGRGRGRVQEIGEKGRGDVLTFLPDLYSATTYTNNSFVFQSNK